MFDVSLVHFDFISLHALTLDFCYNVIMTIPLHLHNNALSCLK